LHAPLIHPFKEAEMFASRRSLFFLSRRRRARSEIAATVGIAAASAAIAAAAVYFMDPNAGKQRRTALGERVVRASREGANLATKIGRSTYERATGMYQQSKRHLHSVAERATL
jgi:hypothetical protein